MTDSVSGTGLAEGGGDAAGGGYLGYTGGWRPVVALVDALEAGASDATRDLRRETHRAGLVTSFDWPTWMTGRGRELAGQPDQIAQATLEECRRLLVAHLRRDRFVTDHLLGVIAAGEVVAILRRVQTILDASAAAPAPDALPLTTTTPIPAVSPPQTANSTRPPSATPRPAAAGDAAAGDAAAANDPNPVTPLR